MNDLMTPFAFDEHLVRVVTKNDAPWFVGKDVCACLSIAKHHQALDALDPDERDTCTTGTPSGDQRVIIVSEPGVYRLVFRSRKPEAERFKRWLAHEVLPTLRKTGRFAAEPAADGPIGSARELANAPVLHRLYLLDRVTKLYGRAVGQAMYRQLGLPPVPPPPPTDLDEARVCLRHLVDSPSTREGALWRDLIEEALEGGEEARLLVQATGIRIIDDGRHEGFLVANRHPQLADIYAGTDWSKGRWMRVLRRLPGASAFGPQRWQGQVLRSTFVPAELLDDCMRPLPAPT